MCSTLKLRGERCPHASGAQARSSCKRVPLKKALVTAQALPRHPQVKAGSEMPGGRWFNEIRSLVGKAQEASILRHDRGHLQGVLLSNMHRAIPGNLPTCAPRSTSYGLRRMPAPPSSTRVNDVERPKRVMRPTSPIRTNTKGRRLTPMLWASAGRGVVLSRRTSTGSNGPPSSGRISRRNTMGPSIPKSFSRSTSLSSRPPGEGPDQG